MAFFPPSPLRALACFSCNQKRFHCLTIKLLEKASLAVALWLRLRQSQVASSKKQVQKSTECSLESRKNLPERTKRKLQLGLAWAKVNENIAGIPHGNGSPINVAGLHLQQALAQGHRGTGAKEQGTGECGCRRAKFTFRQTNTKPDCGRQRRQRAASKELPTGRSKK